MWVIDIGREDTSIILVDKTKYRLTFLVGLNVGLSVGLEDGSFVGDDEGDNEGVAVGTGYTLLNGGQEVSLVMAV